MSQEGETLVVASAAEALAHIDMCFRPQEDGTWAEAHSLDLDLEALDIGLQLPKGIESIESAILAELG